MLHSSSNYILLAFFSTKLKNRTTVHCSFFKMVASSLIGIFSHRMVSNDECYPVHALTTSAFCIPLFFLFTSLLHTRTNLTWIHCFGSSVVTIVGVTHFFRACLGFHVNSSACTDSYSFD